MISIYMIITTMASTALAKVGQSLLFHLPNTANTEFTLTKDSKYRILKRVKNQTVTLNEEFVASNNQFDLITRGTFNLGSAKERHSGHYTLEEFRPNGTLLKMVSVHLEIQAPLSEPTVTQICLSPEEMKVSCFSKEGVELILRLDGLLLIHRVHSLTPSNCTTNIQSKEERIFKHDQSIVSNVTIGLHGQLKGNLTCHVWNKISRHETAFHLTACNETSLGVHFATVAMTAGVATIILALSLTFCLVYNKTRTLPINEGISKEAFSLLLCYI
ncbi:uncharacterized protein LOC113170886 isoform X2 [Anabas testudineus]|uniref:uncharacterized protein LOC113170886 isoform X2 n=1 Tax=Anabas testudineus TaxID=64144 RepID=UPI000E45613F|nr:uncharacterized protein LOC113170886 isoform X2 [Anabas testudineus]